MRICRRERSDGAHGRFRDHLRMRAQVGEHRGVVIGAAAQVACDRRSDLKQVIRAGHHFEQLPVRREHAAKFAIVGGGKDVEHHVGSGVLHGQSLEIGHEPCAPLCRAGRQSHRIPVQVQPDHLCFGKARLYGAGIVPLSAARIHQREGAGTVRKRGAQRIPYGCVESPCKHAAAAFKQGFIVFVAALAVGGRKVDIAPAAEVVAMAVFTDQALVRERKCAAAPGTLQRRKKRRKPSSQNCRFHRALPLVTKMIIAFDGRPLAPCHARRKDGGNTKCG